jgi:hypothetical protein
MAATQEPDFSNLGLTVGLTKGIMTYYQQSLMFPVAIFRNQLIFVAISACLMLQDGHNLQDWKQLGI